MITEVETGTITTLFTEATNLTVNSLHPYYTYSCIVAAETTGLGPYSHPVDVQLPETGMCQALDHQFYDDLTKMQNFLANVIILFSDTS